LELTSYLAPFRSYRSLSFKFRILCVFEPPFGGLGTTYDVRLGLIGKRIVDFLEVFYYVLRLSRYERRDRKSAISLQRGHFDQKFQVEGVAPPNVFARLVRLINAL